MVERASASCEVLIDGNVVPCTPEELFSGSPTILAPLSITWGRRGAWDQPDAGSASFRIRDQRTSPQPIADGIHVGSKIDVFAEAPNPDPQPEVVMDQDFNSAPTSGGFLSPRWWAFESIPSTLRRTNLYPDPAFTTVTGKAAGGSAQILLDPAWKVTGQYSIRITPNGSNNTSALFLYSSSSVLNGFVPGQTYTISATIRLAGNQTGTLNAFARRIVVAASGVPNPIVAQSDQAPNTSNTETRLAVTFTVPDGATGVNILLYNGAPVSNVWWDAVLLTQSNASNHHADQYFDGSTTRAGYVYAWTGTANDSSSTERYAVTDPASNVFIYSAADGYPVGEGTRSAWLASAGTRARFLFPPEQWGRPWMRDLRPIQHGETWTYSFMARLPAGTTASFSTRGFSSSQKDGQTIQLTVDGLLARTITGTGNWETYTGTIMNATAPELPRWPVFALQVTPENTGPGMPAVDAITYTAPPLPTNRVQVWAGRVTDLDVVKGVGRTAIEITVTATGEIVEVENVSVGDTPWTTEILENRIDRIISLIPLPVEDFSVSRDLLPTEFVAPRDIDAQPALGLLREYAAMVLGVVWPINVPGARNHAWIENVARRVTGWTGPVGQLSACSMPRDKVTISQAADQVITVADVSWLEYIDGEYVERSEPTVDMAAAAIYGARRLGLQTEFIDVAAAQRAGTSIMNSARASDWGLTGMEFDTKQVDNTDGQAQTLLMILLNSAQRPGAWLTITDLPEWMPVELASGFVEGGTIEYVAGRWRFDLTLSAGGTAP